MSETMHASADALRAACILDRSFGHESGGITDPRSSKALAIALGSGWHMVLMTLLVFGVCHLVEGYVVSPMVQDRMVKLPPALLILSMTFMGTVFGPMGIIMASPLAAAALVLVSELYVVDVLGDESGRDVTTRK